jgi:hypothetical protein
MTVHPKFAKLVAKGAVGIVGSALLGALWKLEQQVADRVEAHFDPDEEEAITEPTQD